MHELALTQEIVHAVRKFAEGRNVRRVVLEIGRLSSVVPDAIRLCFEVCAAEEMTPLPDLQIVEVPGHARCRECNGEVVLNSSLDACGCGSISLELLAGQQLRIIELELD